jgi:hypothetical protein
MEEGRIREFISQAVSLSVDRRVARTTLRWGKSRGQQITIFTSLLGPALWMAPEDMYETMVMTGYGRFLDRLQFRYPTFEEALTGHDVIVDMITWVHIRRRSTVIRVKAQEFRRASFEELMEVMRCQTEEQMKTFTDHGITS